MRVAALSIHPAPYRDPVFAEVHRRGGLSLDVITMFPLDVGHPYSQPNHFEYHNIQLGRARHIVHGWFYHSGLLSVLRAGGYDVLVVPAWHHTTSQAALAYCWLHGTPVVYTGDAIRPIKIGISQWPSLIIQDVVLRLSAAAWVPGAASRAWLEERGFPSDRIFEGAYCLDAEHLFRQAERRRSERNNIRAAFGASPAQFVFPFAGRMIPERGLEHLVSAAAELAERQSNVAIWLVGDGPSRPTILQLIERFSVRCISLLDPRPMEELTDLYVAADAYVLPSVSETYSLALAHAAVVGLPLITTTAVGATPDYVRHHDSGLIVSPAHSKQLADAMFRLCSNTRFAQDLGRAAQKRALVRSVAWAADQFEAAVRKAVGQAEYRSLQ